MREILFRGYNKNRKWIYGMLEQNNLTNRYTICNMQDGVSYLVDESSIGQYTGFVDKCGNKIFEGDIISNGSTDYIVKFKMGCWTAENKINFEQLFLFVLFNLQVIGNIYEEKLKEGKNNVNRQKNITRTNK